MRILIARHGQTEWNLQHRVQGQGDSPLTATGAAQAEALADAWQDQGIAEIVSSTLGRARETARIVAARLGCACRAEAGLGEQRFGDYEGWQVPRLRERHPEIDDIFQGRLPDLAPPGGESFREAAQRTLQALAALPAEPARTVGVIAHGNCLKGLLWLLSGEEGEAERFRHANASFSELRADAAGLKIVRWCVDDHLRSAIDA